jgi:hypothetical protein
MHESLESKAQRAAMIWQGVVEDNDHLLEYLRDVAKALHGKEDPFKRIGGGTPSLGYKRPQGRPCLSSVPRFSGPDGEKRFFRDPNRVAAAIAATCIAEFREEWGRTNPNSHLPYKIRQADGTNKRLHVIAAEYAVEFVNCEYVGDHETDGPADQIEAHTLLPRRRKAGLDTVLGLLHYNRTAWPDYEWI